MTSPDNGQVDTLDDADPAGRRPWRITVVAVLAVVVLAGVVGAAVAFGRAPISSTPPAAPTTAAPTTPDPYRVAGDICTDSEAAMEQAISVAQEVLPDAESRSDFLDAEERAVVTRCPALRPTFDRASLAAAGIEFDPPNP